jgi:CheY-like chemotaxis protein
MVYGFVKQSNGHIKIYSEEGHGTTVKLYLPQAACVPDATVAETGISAGDHGDESILIVEDDALVREYVVTQVSRFGYHTLAAGNAAEALAIIDGPERIDLLFTDVIIPGGMNGRQLATEALKRRSGLKVLYTSGYTENAIVHHGRLDPGVLLLPKPYLSSDLARMIRTALAS